MRRLVAGLSLARSVVHLVLVDGDSSGTPASHGTGSPTAQPVVVDVVAIDVPATAQATSATWSTWVAERLATVAADLRLPDLRLCAAPTVTGGAEELAAWTRSTLALAGLRPVAVVPAARAAARLLRAHAPSDSAAFEGLLTVAAGERSFLAIAVENGRPVGDALLSADAWRAQEPTWHPAAIGTPVRLAQAAGRSLVAEFVAFERRVPRSAHLPLVAPGSGLAATSPVPHPQAAIALGAALLAFDGTLLAEGTLLSDTTATRPADRGASGTASPQSPVATQSPLATQSPVATAAEEPAALAASTVGPHGTPGATAPDVHQFDEVPDSGVRGLRSPLLPPGVTFDMGVEAWPERSSTFAAIPIFDGGHELSDPNGPSDRCEAEAQGSGGPTPAARRRSRGPALLAVAMAAVAIVVALAGGSLAGHTTPTEGSGDPGGRRSGPELDGASTSVPDAGPTVGRTVSTIEVGPAPTSLVPVTSVPGGPARSLPAGVAPRRDPTVADGPDGTERPADSASGQADDAGASAAPSSLGNRPDQSRDDHDVVRHPDARLRDGRITVEGAAPDIASAARWQLLLAELVGDGGLDRAVPVIPGGPAPLRLAIDIDALFEPDVATFDPDAGALLDRLAAAARMAGAKEVTLQIAAGRLASGASEPPSLTNARTDGLVGALAARATIASVRTTGGLATADVVGFSFTFG